MKILIQNRQRHKPLNNIKITKAARKILTALKYPTAELSILFVGDKRMQHLNLFYRGKNKSTDVLSFSQTSGKSEVRSQKFKKDKKLTKEFFTSCFLLPTSHFLLGDVVINVPRAEAQAKTYEWGFYDELYRLLIHGIMHLSGYDHEESGYRARIMRKKERELFDAVKEMD
ncbi:MAG: rRNA maturation RNase YbeY [Nitrospirae bacterium]|nr:rRNA maturation RNase YbeY [Nitrospirota bacterium]